MPLIPYVIEKSGREERAMDIYSRLLKDRIVLLGSGVNDDVDDDNVGYAIVLGPVTGGKLISSPHDIELLAEIGVALLLFALPLAALLLLALVPVVALGFSCFAIAQAIGGSGFIGRRLAAVLGGDGYDVVILTRGQVRPPIGPVSFAHWNPAEPDEALTALISGSHAVVNLCGESIGGPRWTPARHQAASAGPHSAFAAGRNRNPTSYSGRSQGGW